MCICFWVPQEEGDGEMLYVGEGDPVRPRLNHYSEGLLESLRVFCHRTAGGALNKAHVQYLGTAG